MVVSVEQYSHIINLIKGVINIKKELDFFDDEVDENIILPFQDVDEEWLKMVSCTKGVININKNNDVLNYILDELIEIKERIKGCKLHDDSTRELEYLNNKLEIIEDLYININQKFGGNK